MSGILLSVLAEIPSAYLACILIDHKEVGRKNLIQYSYFICAVSCFLISFMSTPDFIFFILTGTVKFFITCSFNVLFLFTSEIYSTNLRATGLGFNNAICRFGGIVMPILSYFFFALGPTGPAFAFAIMATLSTIAAFKIPNDTTKMDLDIYHELDTVK
jgi:MFS transporter, putative metabolite:H+ symporter